MKYLRFLIISLTCLGVASETLVMGLWSKPPCIFRLGVFSGETITLGELLIAAFTLFCRSCLVCRDLNLKMSWPSTSSLLNNAEMKFYDYLTWFLVVWVLNVHINRCTFNNLVETSIFLNKPVGFWLVIPSSKSSSFVLGESSRTFLLVGDRSKKSPYFFGFVLFLTPLLVGVLTWFSSVQ